MHFKVHKRTWPCSWNWWISKLLILTFIIMYFNFWQLSSHQLVLFFFNKCCFIGFTVEKPDSFLDFPGFLPQNLGQFSYGYPIWISSQLHCLLMNITPVYHFHWILLKCSCPLMNVNDMLNYQLSQFSYMYITLQCTCIHWYGSPRKIR